MIVRVLTRQSNEPVGVCDNDLACVYPSFDLIGRGPDWRTSDLGSSVQYTKEWQAVRRSREQ